MVPRAKWTARMLSAYRVPVREGLADILVATGGVRLGQEGSSRQKERLGAFQTYTFSL
jgi:hypothetical protein